MPLPEALAIGKSLLSAGALARKVKAQLETLGNTAHLQEAVAVDARAWRAQRDAQVERRLAALEARPEVAAAVEAMLTDPQFTRLHRNLEFEAAPTGEWLDLAIHVTPEKRETDWEFRSGMTAAARVEKDRVLIMMRLPWDHWIHKPQKGERWRVNLFRCVGSGESRGYLAWRPTHAPEPAFHVPAAFGWLRFE